MAQSRHYGSIGYGMRGQMHPEASTTKVPPYWEPQMESAYPFRIWLQDIDLWSYSTEVPLERQAPAVVQRIGGTARALLREVPSAQLAQGDSRPYDPQQFDEAGVEIMQIRTGLQIVVDLLKKRFMPLDQEQQIRVLNEFFMFRRDRSEDVDSLLTRFELMNYRASTVSGLALNIVGKSWLILHHMGIPKEKWPLLLAPTQGMLPSTEEQYNAFLEYCRRNAHMWENFGEMSLQPRHMLSSQTGYPVAFNIGDSDNEQDQDNHDYDENAVAN